ncbi:MAG: hypothetical protein F7C35_06415 [Desulfurococcales archaeon]|nr:hypothetical protein [Desulfurococcales archaeon]
MNQDLEYGEHPIYLKGWKPATALFAANFIGALLQVNAPSFLSGYGLVTAASVLTLLMLEPALAALVVFAGHLIALPFILGSHSMILEVALLGTILRPLVVYVASRARRRLGDTGSVLTFSVLDPLLALTAATLYYGDDGIHASLTIYDFLVALLILVATRLRGAPAALAYTSVVVYILSTAFFPSMPALLGSLAALALAYTTGKGGGAWKPLSVGLVLLIIGVAVGIQPFMVNAKIIGHPLKPSSYTHDRWGVSGEPCGMIPNVLQGVHDPERLRIVEGCVVVTGTIVDPPFVAADGDYCFDLHVENTTYKPIMTLGNIILRKGKLHAEIIPSNISLLNTTGGGLCVGDKVRIAGPLVVDTDHGQWAEIHPVLFVEVIERGQGPCTMLNNP